MAHVDQTLREWKAGCRRCSECQGADHHWMGPESDEDEPEIATWVCKHCDATLPYDADTDDGFPRTVTFESEED